MPVFESISVICTITGNDCHTNKCTECMKTWKIVIPVSNPEKKVLLEISGWVDDGEEFTNVPHVCPKCGGKLTKVDALKICNTLLVMCKEQRLIHPCRWCEIYELPQ